MPNFLYPFLFVAITAWVGLPWAAAFFRRGEKQLSLLFFHALIAGFPTLGLAAQIAWTLGWNATEAAGKFLLLVSAVNAIILWAALRGKTAPARSENAGMLGFLAVMALLLSVFAANHDRAYYGRAWGDQVNYSLTADYLQHEHPSLEAPPYTKPAASTIFASGLLRDRIGQSALHAWLSQLSRRLPLESFYDLSCLAVAVFFGVLYLTGRTLGLPDRLAALVATAASLAPPLHAIHLESFLSQIVVTPYIVYLVLIAHRLLTEPGKIWFGLFALGSAWTFIAYFEFFPLLVCMAVLQGGFVLVCEPGRWRRLLALGAALGLGLGVGCWLSPAALELMKRASAVNPVFDVFFPWALKAEGFARLVLGDGATILSPLAAQACALSILLLTAAGLAGLLYQGFREKSGLALACAGLALIPIGVGLLPGHRSYQHYKLLQSFWPLIWLGFGSWALLRPGLRRGVGVGAGILLGVMGVASWSMLQTEATGRSARSGLSPYLQHHGYQDLAELLRGQPASRIIVSTPSRREWNDQLINGVVSLQLSRHFAQIQTKWLPLGDHMHRQPVSPLIPEDPTVSGLRTLQPEFYRELADTLILQIGAPYLSAAPQIMPRVAVSGRWQLFRGQANRWLLANTVVALEPKAQTSADALFVGQSSGRYIRLDLESVEEVPAGVLLEIDFVTPSPKLTHRWHLYSNTGYGEYTYTATGSIRLKTGPLRKGVTELFFGPNPETPDPATESQFIKVTHIVYGL